MLEQGDLCSLCLLFGPGTGCAVASCVQAWLACSKNLKIADLALHPESKGWKGLPVLQPASYLLAPCRHPSAKPTPCGVFPRI